MQLATQQAELNALQSQINPHFMFNVIEGIRMHSLLRGENKTAGILGDFALLMRQAIQWDKDLVTVQEEQGYVKTYLDIQKHRFGERLAYSFIIQEECRERLLPKFSILTLVENACIHGIEPSISGGNISIMVSEDDGMMCLAVMDSGEGMDKEKLEELRRKINQASIQQLGVSERIGVLNTIVRLKMYYQGEIEVEINSMEGEGTEIFVNLPLADMKGEGAGIDMNPLLANAEGERDFERSSEP